MTREQGIELLTNRPAKFGHMLGFTKLNDLHNAWIVDMVKGKEDTTLEAARGTYKTTCVSLALSIIALLLPNYRTMFMRKTDDDVKEVIKQVQKILTDPHTQYFCNCIYGVNLKMGVASSTEITTNLTTDTRGTNQLVGVGSKASLTGKHFDRIFTDDIINVQDRISKAERERTKIVYQEIQNIKNRGGRIYNTLTPWHPEDASCLMPNINRFDCYHEEVQKIITPEELEKIKASMIPSLFAANYELRHIASEDVIFTNPKTGAPLEMVKDGIMHLDSAYYGEDYTAWCVIKSKGDAVYMYGRIRRAHVEECYSDILETYQTTLAGKLFTEDNGDKGFVARDIRRLGIRVSSYHESMNKYLKIVTYLKAIWDRLEFVEGTDEAFIQQICDYFEEAEHDDAPDTAASAARLIYNKIGKAEYIPLYN